MTCRPLAASCALHHSQPGSPAALPPRSLPSPPPPPPPRPTTLHLARLWRTWERARSCSTASTATAWARASTSSWWPRCRVGGWVGGDYGVGRAGTVRPACRGCHLAQHCTCRLACQPRAAAQPSLTKCRSPSPNPSTAADAVTIPVIASSGAGAPEHFSEVFQKTRAAAALAAGIFHRREVRRACGQGVAGWG